MTAGEQQQRTWAALNVLCKWRSLFAGWQLGTRVKSDPESDAIRDHREVTILLRVEVSALAGLLLRKGLITDEEFNAALERDAKDLCRRYEERFPGVTATESGLTYDLSLAAPWMKDWRP